MPARAVARGQSGTACDPDSSAPHEAGPPHQFISERVANSLFEAPLDGSADDKHAGERGMAPQKSLRPGKR